MRLLKTLDKYDDNLTVAELKKTILEDAELKAIKDEEIYNKVKLEFINVYLKRITDCPFFGETLEVYYIEEIIDKALTEDYEFVFEPKGTKISFSEKGINIRDLKNDRFSVKTLKEMKKICYLEWNEHANHYNEISNKLQKIIK